MKIHLHDLQSQYQVYRDEINLAIQSVLDSTQFIMGQAVTDLEKTLAGYLGANNVISCASGTDALMLALMSIDLQPGDEVITTPFTFIATAEVISLLGGVPVFVDIDEETYNIDASKIGAAITDKTRAIIPVSLYGQPADMDEINHIAATLGKKINKKIYVIEDAAQSFGAEYRGRKSANLSDIGCLSFFPTKPLGCYGDGGAVVVNDEILAEKIKSLRVHGQTKRYYHKYIGFNCRLDTIQAAVLMVKLKYFDDELNSRHRIADYYNQLLNQSEYIIPYIRNDRHSVYAQYSIRTKQRDQVIEHMKLHDVPVAVHYPQPLHLQECFKYLNYNRGDFPIAEVVSQEILSLPMSAFVTEIQQKYVVNVLLDALCKNEIVAVI